MSHTSTNEIFSKEERDQMLVQMNDAKDAFYASAVAIRNHPFIEFAGVMYEYILVCRLANDKGIDFTQCNTHTGNALPMDSFNVAYIAEKLDCIFQDALTVKANVAGASA